MRALILCVLLAGPVGAELVQYRATAPTVVDQWFPGATLVDGEHTLTVILAAQVPDTMVVDYTVDTVANLWRVDLISFPVHPYVGTTVVLSGPSVPAMDLDWVPTNELVDMDSWTSIGLLRHMVVPGLSLSGDTIAFSEVPEPINPGAPWIFNEDGGANLVPIESWAPENEYVYPIQWRGHHLNRQFHGVQYATFGPAMVVPEPSAFWLIGLLGVLMVGRKLWRK